MSCPERGTIDAWKPRLPCLASIMSTVRTITYYAASTCSGNSLKLYTNHKITSIILSFFFSTVFLLGSLFFGLGGMPLHPLSPPLKKVGMGFLIFGVWFQFYFQQQDSAGNQHGWGRGRGQLRVRDHGFHYSHSLGNVSVGNFSSWGPGYTIFLHG